jgi:hypothetical protein
VPLDTGAGKTKSYRGARLIDRIAQKAMLPLEP